jgi:hypothetical protein
LTISHTDEIPRGAYKSFIGPSTCELIHNLYSDGIGKYGVDSALDLSERFGRRRRLNGSDLLPKVVTGVQFVDGEELQQQAA